MQQDAKSVTIQIYCGVNVCSIYREVVPIISQSKLVLMLYLGILHRVIIGWWLGAILLHRINLCIHDCVGAPLCNFTGWRLCKGVYFKWAHYYLLMPCSPEYVANYYV